MSIEFNAGSGKTASMSDEKYRLANGAEVDVDDGVKFMKDIIKTKGDVYAKVLMEYTMQKVLIRMMHDAGKVEESAKLKTQVANETAIRTMQCWGDEAVNKAKELTVDCDAFIAIGLKAIDEAYEAHNEHKE